MTSNLEVNIICVSDPTLEYSESLRLAWYAGNRNQPLQTDLPNVIEQITQQWCSPHSITFGASGGGFAAMYYSAFIPRSLCLAINPQTVLRRLYDDSVLDYARVAFRARTLEHAHSFVDRSITGDLRHLYRGGIINNTLAVLQNYTDRHHVQRHMKTLMDSIPVTEQLHIKFGDWGKGHVAPELSYLRETLKLLVDSKGKWPQALSSLGFTTRISSAEFINMRNEYVMSAADNPEVSAQPVHGQK